MSSEDRLSCSAGGEQTPSSSSTSDQRSSKPARTTAVSPARRAHNSSLSNNRPQPRGRGSDQSPEDAYDRGFAIAVEETQQAQRTALQRRGQPGPSDRGAHSGSRINSRADDLARKRPSFNESPRPQNTVPRDGPSETGVPYTTVILDVLRRCVEPRQALLCLNKRLEVFLQIRQDRGDHVLNDETIRQFTHAIENVKEEIRELNRPPAERRPRPRTFTIPPSPRRQPSGPAVTSAAPKPGPAGPSGPAWR
jgi:hypothetical protein